MTDELQSINQSINPTPEREEFWQFSWTNSFAVSQSYRQQIQHTWATVKKKHPISNMNKEVK